MNKEDIAYLIQLSEAYKKRLKKLQLQAAKAGNNCPAEILIEIEEIQENIKQINEEVGKFESYIERGTLTNLEGRSTLNRLNYDIETVDDRLQAFEQKRMQVVREKRVYRFFGIPIWSVEIFRTIIVLIFAFFIAGLVYGVLTGLIKLPFPDYFRYLPTTTPGLPTTVGTLPPTLQTTAAPTGGPTAIAQQPPIIVPVLPSLTPTATPTLVSTNTPTLTSTPIPTRTPKPTDTPQPTFHPPPAVDEKREEKAIILINDHRAGNGCEPVHYSSELTGAARRHSVDMAEHGFFDHTGSDGTKPGERITQAGYRWAFGIPGTLGWVEMIETGSDSADVVVQSFMNGNGSESILNCNYHDIGVGYTTNTNGASYWTVLLTRGKR